MSGPELMSKEGGSGNRAPFVSCSKTSVLPFKIKLIVYTQASVQLEINAGKEPPSPAIDLTLIVGLKTGCR